MKCLTFTPRKLMDRHCCYIISLCIICLMVTGEGIILLHLQMNKPRPREFGDIYGGQKVSVLTFCRDLFVLTPPLPFCYPIVPPVSQEALQFALYIELKFIWMTDVNSHANLPLFPTPQCMQYTL